jgi:arginine exporter protein ArgO
METQSNDGFSDKDLVSFYQTECATRNNLWTVFVVATFATAGFVMTAQHEVRTLTRVALTLSFVAFAAGHWFLLKQNTSALNAFEELLKRHSKEELRPYVGRIAIGSGMVSPFIPHAIIDICVLVAIWF